MKRLPGRKKPLFFSAFFLCSLAVSAQTFQRGRLILGFEEGTGRWNELRLKGDERNILGEEGLPEIVLEGKDLEWPSDWETSAPEAEPGQNDTLVAVSQRAGEWSVVREYRILEGAPMVAHRARCTWRGQEPLKVWGCRLRVPGVTLGPVEDAVWCFPGNYPVRKKRICEAKEGDQWRERGWTWSDTGLCMAESQACQRALLVTFALEDDHATAWVEGEKKSVSLGHRFNTVARVKHGDVLEFGTQWIRVADLEEGSLLTEARRLAETAHPGPPLDRPEWLNGTVIAELHPWGRLESWGGDKGQRMKDLARRMPYLKRLGIRSVWILPVSNKPPWVYFLPSFNRIDPQVAAPAGLRDLIQVCHELDMHLLMDLVTYGVSPDSPDVASLPQEVWCRDEKGALDKAWGGTVLPADLSVQAWQDHAVALCSYWVEAFGCDGFRLDCGGQGQKPNWSASGPKLNLGMLAGGVAQNQKIREAIREIRPSAVLLPEAGNPVHFRSGDLLFDYPFYMVCREFPKTSSPGKWVKDAEAWLEAQKLTHTHRQLLSLVRFLENHDTVSAQEYFGLGPAQALTSLCVFLPGVYLFHQQEEVGLGPLLSSWLHLRQQLPEIFEGEVDFEGVWTEDPEVLSFVRVSDAGALVVAVHFGASPTRSKIEWAETYTDRFPLALNALDGFERDRAHSGDEVEFPAFGTRLLVLLPAGGKWTLNSMWGVSSKGKERLLKGWVGHGVSDEKTRHRIRVGPVEEWYVRTGEGFLWDRFEGYLTEDVPPLDRAWNPWREGFLDEANQVAVGVIADDLRAVEVSVSQPERLLGLSLEDPSGLGKQVELVVEGRPGTIPFKVREFEWTRPYCEELQREASYQKKKGIVEVDPHWVRVNHPNYTAFLSRRRGGVLAELRTSASHENLLAGCAEIYTDYGLFARGRHVGSEWETNPRLRVTREADKTQIVFQGRLRRPSWNGVQLGAPVKPETTYTLRYIVDESASLKVQFSISSEKEGKDVHAFLAYRLPFQVVDRWEAHGFDETIQGDPSAKEPKEDGRVCEAKAIDPSQVAYDLFCENGVQLRLERFKGEPFPPQNPFLLRGGPDQIHFFFAVLDGKEITLEKGKEYAYSFTLRME